MKKAFENVISKYLMNKWVKWTQVFSVAIFLLISGQLCAQTITISSGGQTISPGTNWSITGNILTVTGPANIDSWVIIDHLYNYGSLAIVGNTNTFAITISEDITLGISRYGRSLTFGSEGNNGIITVNNTVSIEGDLAFYGGEISLNGSLNTSLSAGKNILLKAYGRIIQGTSSTVTTSGGNVVYWADIDANGGDIIMNSGSGITTNGGHLWMGGGSGSSVWNGMTVGTGAAMSSSSAGILLNAPSISTGAGNVYLSGRSTSSAADGHGIWLNGGSIKSTSGTIEFSGTGSSVGSINCDGLRIEGTVESETGALTFTGYSNTNEQSEGIALEPQAKFTSTGGGSISLIANIIYFNTSSRLQSSGPLTIYPTTNNASIGIGGASGTLKLPSTCFSTNIVDGFSTITVGNTTTGDITVNSVTLRDNTRLLNAGKVIIGAGQTVTAPNIKLQIDKNLTLETGSKIVR